MVSNAVTLNLKELLSAEQWLRAQQLKGAAASGLLRDLGAELVSQAKDRIEHEKSAPDGTPWAGLSESYKAWLSKLGRDSSRDAGVFDGHMRDSIEYSLLNQYALEWGSSKDYAGYFNGSEGYARKRDYPLRPFIGLSDENEADLVDIAEDYLEANAKRAEK